MSTARPALPSEWLDLLAEKAPQLRQAGVTSFELEGVRVELAPAEPEEPPTKPDEAEEFPDPLDDPASYPDGRVPGFERLHRRSG